MRWIRNLKNSLLLICLTSVMTYGQTLIDLTYNPGISYVPPGANGRFSFDNVGVNLAFPGESGNLGFFTGFQLINRGTGGRVPVLDQNNSFVEWVRTSENFYFLHIPIGMWLKQEHFYIQGGIAWNRFLSYKGKEGRYVVSRTPPSWLQKNLLGLHLEAGLLKELNETIHLKAGVYLANTFSGETSNPFVNFGVNVGITFLLNNDTGYDEEEGDYGY